MKKLHMRMVATGLAALLLASSTLLTACQFGPDPLPDEGDTTAEVPGDPTTPGDDGNGTSDDTSGDTPGGNTPGDGAGTEEIILGEGETVEPGQTTPSTPSGGLIGDGVATAGVFPTFSEPGGLYTETSKSITLTAPEGYTVRYTTDGSLPTRSSTEYSKAIRFRVTVGNATVIRAACFNSNGVREGQVITQTYVRVASPESLHYTVMISTDQKNLNAMYANVDAKVERAAHAEIISPDGTRVVSQDVGLRLFGGSSRSQEQKSFKITARKDGYFGTQPYVGAGTFTYPFFPERTVLAGKNAGQVLDKFDALVLRNGGNDSLLAIAEDGADAALLRDGLANRFVHRYAPHVGASLSQFAAVYLNGEYYGILELRENQNEDYIKRIYGVLDDDVVVVKSELDTERACSQHTDGAGCRFCGSWFFYETDTDAASQAEMAAWIALCQKAAGAVNAPEAQYRAVFDEVSAALDLENVKEYVAMSCFFCNTDWPHNNVRVWRYTGAPMEGVTITDGKWRFTTRDMDMGMARYTSGALPELNTTPGVNMFAWVLSNYVSGYEDVQKYNDALYLQGLFAFLMRDDTFRADFAAYCREITSDEAITALLEMYQQAYDQLEPMMAAHFERWQYAMIIGNAQIWNRSAGFVKSFIEARPAAFLADLEELLALYV